jgi:hypothetical protein
VSHDDLPLIRCRPTPSDTELAEQRDRQHAIDCDHYWQRMAWIEDEWPISEVRG